MPALGPTGTGPSAYCGRVRTSARVALGAGTAFVVLALLIATEFSPLMDLDQDVVGPANGLAREHPTYRHVMTGVTWALNSSVVLGYVALVAIALIAARRRPAALWLTAVVGSGTVLNPLLKVIVDRDRPTVAEPIDTFNGLSFPSGHANSAALFCAAVLVVFWSSWGRLGRRIAVVLALAVALLCGWTRLTLGAHYLSDVVGGFLFGLAWVALWVPALPGLQRRSSGATEWTS